jgi:hypothetical protein
MEVLTGAFCLIAVPYAMVFPAWWANLLLFAGCGLLPWRRTAWAALALGLVALALAASTLVHPETQHVRVGFWVWLASIALLPAGALRGLRRSGQTPDDTDRDWFPGATGIASGVR